MLQTSYCRLVVAAPVTALLAAVATFWVAPFARAQSLRLQAQREALATYDLNGERTLNVLRELCGAAGGASSDVAREARFLCAMVALDLTVAASVDPVRAALEQRTADVLGVPRAELRAHLRSELEALRTGVYRGPATEALGALALLDALGSGGEVPWSSHRGVRRDLLWLRVAGEALGDPERIAAFGRDPCSEGASCTEPYAQMDAAMRRRVVALADIAAAARRVERAAAGGDPLAQSLVAIARARSADVAQRVERPAPRLPEALGVASGDDAGEPAHADLLIVVTTAEVRLARPAAYAVRDGAVVAVDDAPDVLPRSIAVPLPREYRPVIGALDEVTRALAARPLPEGGVVALAAAPDVEAHVLSRVVASALAAGRPPSLLVRRAADGTMRGAPVVFVARDEIGQPGDLVVRVRMGGYGLARGRGREQMLPRVRTAHGMAFDLEGLAAALRRIPHRRAVLDAMTTVSARDVLDAAFRMAGRGPVALLRP